MQTPGAVISVTSGDDEFNERFLREGTDAIEFDGMLVRLRMVLPDVPAGRWLSVVFERHTDEVEQALCLSTSKGSFEINQERLRKVVLWTTTAPAQVQARLTNRVPTRVVVWNGWQRRGGGLDAGLRYAGLLIEDVDAATWRLRCSDGIGGPDFDDLIATVSLHETNPGLD